MATKYAATITGQEMKSTTENDDFFGGVIKKTLVTFVVGLTAIVLPRIATAQNVVTDWNEIAVTTALAGNNGAIVQPTPKSGRAIVPCLPPIDSINEGRQKTGEVTHTPRASLIRGFGSTQPPKPKSHAN
jgi:hypothetical protein